jgi:PAS domain S-box-containing protein
LLLNSRTTRLALEAAEAAGISRAAVVEPLGLKEEALVARGARVDWTTFTLVLEQIGRLVDGDPERLRDIGRGMTRVPSYEPVRRLARSVVSIRTLYTVATRWIAPANFPHLPLTATFVSDRRLRLDGEIPRTYAACTPFFHICDGSVLELPRLIELPPSTLVESRVTPRTSELVIDLPPSRTIIERVRRGVGALLDAREALQVLEEQAEEVATNVEALGRTRDELRLLLERLPDLVVVHVSGTIVWANRAMLQAIGYPRVEDVTGTALLDLVDEGSKHMMAERMNKSDACDARLGEAVLRSRAGDVVVVEIAPTQDVVFDGVPARLVVGRDVTERVRMEQRLVVVDRLASVGLLAAGVGHEVDSPLASVLENVQAAQKELAVLGDGARVAGHVLSVALEGVDRIRVIVRELMMLSRGEDGEPGAIDVRTVATSTLELASREIERTARLIEDFAPAPLVRANEARIAQVLLNLVGNALEAMKGRPRDQNELRIRIARAADGRLLLEVSDTGTGIPHADLARVFEPFFTTKPAGLGTGLGLAIAQRLIVELGGEITVSSQVDRGATFRVLLPEAASTQGAFPVLPGCHAIRVDST